MIRELKVLILATTALAAFGAVSAGSAHAAEEFHCSVEPCNFALKRDGTGTTAHQVFVVKNSVGESISFTCESITGIATSSTKKTTDLTFIAHFENCKSVLGAATIDMNECHFRISSPNGSLDRATVTYVCVSGHETLITNQTCTVSIGPQGPLVGIGYHNLESIPNREITVTAKVPGIAAKPSGECGIDLTKTPITSEITTANVIVTGEATGGVMADAWWE